MKYECSKENHQFDGSYATYQFRCKRCGMSQVRYLEEEIRDLRHKLHDANEKNNILYRQLAGFLGNA